ncbi:MAG: RNA 3'-terminal phosphate cyclase [Candidatus Hermodarchaeota archaeon]|jgi:RNA 3'-phosphate cyclase|nr:RNA 3'-terminal phosphate cyclase [Candidatus Hermodarchaeota archaeon]
MVVEIDGSILEGGGQILRSAVAFAAVLGKEMVMTKIRAKRTNPGLRPQHLHGILAIKQLTNASVKGAHVGSTRIEFAPERRKGGEIRVDIGTAGSITLILQAVMIVAPFCDYSVKAKVIGGTNVAWSPPIDYLQRVFLPRLRQMQYMGTIELEKRGYYPRGGGSVNAVLHTIHKLTSLTLSETREPSKVSGISYCGSLPRHVAERQAKAAIEKLSEAEVEVGKIQVEHAKDTFSPGSGVCLWTEQDDNRIIGSDGLGRRGLRAEKVGEQVAIDLLREYNTNAPVDLHQADMLIPYLALAEGSSFIPISNLTLHTVTNIHVVEQFIDTKFEVKGEIGAPATIAVKGVGLTGVAASPESSPNEQ